MLQLLSPLAGRRTQTAVSLGLILIHAHTNNSIAMSAR
jgi:hypothetical protein